MQTVSSIFIVTFITVVVSMTRYSQAKSSSGHCELGGQQYKVGDTWQPSLNTPGGNSCVNCTCLPDGDINCVGEECPKVDCEEPRQLEGQCCPICEVGKKEVHETSLPGCDFDGHHYEDGEFFPSNNTAIKPNNDSQCVLCACMKERVSCHLKTCPKCKKKIKVADDCCPLCAENLNQTLAEGDCLYANRRQVNGSTWKPVIGQHEERCVVCTCMNEQVNCSRLQCPSESSLECETPSVDEWGCCQVCPKEKKRRRRKKKKRRCKKAKTAEEKKACKSKRRKNRKRKSQSESATRLDDVIDGLCMPKKTQRLVYHTKGDDFETLAFDNLGDKTVEHIHWTIRKGRVQDTERKLILDVDQYRQNVTVADILGAVKKKDIKRFMRRLDKRQKRCKKKCRRKLLERCIKKMKVKQVDLTRSCTV